MSSDDRQNVEAEIAEIMSELAAARERLSALRSRLPAEPVRDYELALSDGREVRLSELFGDHDDLLVIHNMGRSCPYCTLWADGFKGFLPHLENRAAFAVSSPDEPEVQQEFASSRGWGFTMVSTATSEFTRDMGFLDDEHGYWPGVSAFKRDADGSIRRVGKDVFGPGDDYCALWHLFDLLDGGPGDWQPQFSYAG